MNTKTKYTTNPQPDNGEQAHVRLGWNARDHVRNFAAVTHVYETELHAMAERLDVIAKQVALNYLTLRA